jgi:signal transduction histidine kinase
MKRQLRYIIALALVAVLLITAYQAYWLTDIYSTLQTNLHKDIQEAMRSSDFAEISHRVNKMKEESYGGKMAISVGTENTCDKVSVRNKYNPKKKQETKSPADTGNAVPYDNFSNALKDENAVYRVGLYMQKGIHDGLDKLKPIDVVCYDSILNKRLDSLGVTSKRLTLFLTKEGTKTDTVASFGIKNMAKADTFSMYINTANSQEYVLLIEKHLFSVPRQMNSSLVFSGFTLLILILAFCYIINMIRKMYALDEMKTDFTNNITHELKTPIAIAYAANDALLNFNGNSNKEKIKKYLTISQEQLQILTRLVEQILSLSMERRKSMKLVMETINVRYVVEKLVANQKINKRKEVQFNIDIPADFTICADNLHFNNIINNLIDNAIKYSNDELSINIKTYSDGSRKMISISDTGIGIAKDQQQFIFDKFYRVPHGNIHQVKGYGLGLFYVKSMMEKFNGEISMKSELGKGTTFTLCFNE